MKVKGQPPSSSRLGVVYCIPCDCGACYIRETGRNLTTRTDEHKRAVLHLDSRNALAAHIMQNMDHCIQWQDSTIKDYKSNWYRRCVKESIWIRLTNNTTNTDPGLSINKTWMTMLPNANKNARKECPDGPDTFTTPLSRSTAITSVTAPALVTN